MTYYQLSEQEADEAIYSLCPTGLKLFLYIWRRCPFENSRPDFGVSDLIAHFKVHRDTILRLLRELKSLGLLPPLLHARILNIASRIKRLVKDSVKKRGKENNCPTPTTPIEEQVESDCPNQERSPRSWFNLKKDRRDLGSKTPENENPDRERVSANPGFTNNRESTLNKTIGETPGNEQGWFGQILTAIEVTGVQINNTIQKTIHRLHREFGPAAVWKAELVVGSFQEEQRKGTLRNPGGFLNAALQRCFTPNDDGYRQSKQGRSHSAPAQESFPQPSPPPATATPPATAAPPRLTPKALAKFQQWADSHLLQGDRAAVIAKLQSAIDLGYEDDIVELLLIRRDWKIKLKPGKGLIDVNSV